MPSNQEASQAITRIAGEDLSDSQYLFLKVDSDGKVIKAGNGERANFVSQGKAAEDRAITCAISGRVLVKAGAAVTQGNACQSDANGAAINQASTGIVCGTFLESGATGDLVSIIFDPQGAP